MPAQPNIVLICVDQWRGDCLTIAGHPVVHTPFLDSLALGGARFDRAYSTSTMIRKSCTILPPPPADPSHRPPMPPHPRLEFWRRRLIHELTGREEGYTDGHRLIPARPYNEILSCL